MSSESQSILPSSPLQNSRVRPHKVPSVDSPHSPSAERKVKIEPKHVVQSQIDNSTMSTAYKFAPPPRFAGEITNDPVADAKKAKSWLGSVDDHLRQAKLYTSPWSDEIECEIAISLTDLDARAIAKRIRSELGSDATWLAMSAKLRGYFCPPQSVFDALNTLSGTIQDGAMVTSYIRKFEEALESAIEAGFKDPVAAGKMFIDGLDDDMQDAVTDTMTSQLIDPWIGLRKLTASEAVRELAELAVRRRDYVERESSKVSTATRSRGNVQARVAAMAPPSRPTVRTPQASSSRTTRESRDEIELRRLKLVQAMSRRFNVAQDVVRARLDANVCVRCGSSVHHCRECPGRDESDESKLSSGQSKALAH